MKLVREIKQYQATDGACFNTREEAEQYEEMLQNPHFKKLQERIEKLEQEIRTMKMDIAILHREPARQSWPVGQPIMYDQYHKPQGDQNQRTTDGEM